MRHQRLRLVQLCLCSVLLSLLGAYGEALDVSEFFGYPFGGNRDSTFPVDDDTSLYITASVPFPYFHDFYPGMSVSCARLNYGIASYKVHSRAYHIMLARCICF